MELIILKLENFVLTHGWWGLFLAAVAEEILAPIPSAGIMAIGGLGFANTPLTTESFVRFLLLVILPITTGVTLGSLVPYGLARHYGHPIVDRYGKYIGVTWQHITKLQTIMSKGYADELIFVIARATPIVPSAAVSLVAGFFGWKTKKYLIYTFIATLIKTLILGLISWQLGTAGTRLLNFEFSEGLLLTVITLIGLTIWGITKLRKLRIQGR